MGDVRSIAISMTRSGHPTISGSPAVWYIVFLHALRRKCLFTSQHTASCWHGRNSTCNVSPRKSDYFQKLGTDYCIPSVLCLGFSFLLLHLCLQVSIIGIQTVSRCGWRVLQQNKHNAKRLCEQWHEISWGGTFYVPANVLIFLNWAFSAEIFFPHLYCIY